MGDSADRGGVDNSVVGAGLRNPNNFCFMNAGLQALFHTPAFAEWCEQSMENDIQGIDCWTGRIMRLFAATRGGEKVVEALELWDQSNMQQLLPAYLYGNQEDSQEFIVTLLTKLQDEHAFLAGNEDSFVQCAFEGLLESKITAPGGYESTSPEEMRGLDLDVDIGGSLQGALAKFTAPACLEDYVVADEQSALGFRLVEASKKSSVLLAPDVLLVTLKRTAADGSKKNGHVSFGTTLDLGPFMAAPTPPNNCCYNLCSIVVHTGETMQCGHYVAFSKTGDQWFLYDDEAVVPVPLEVVLEAEAYLLIFQKSTGQGQDENSDQNRVGGGGQTSGPVSLPVAVAQGEDKGNKGTPEALAVKKTITKPKGARRSKTKSPRSPCSQSPTKQGSPEAEMGEEPDQTVEQGLAESGHARVVGAEEQATKGWHSKEGRKKKRSSSGTDSPKGKERDVGKRVEECGQEVELVHRTRQKRPRAAIVAGLEANRKKRSRLGEASGKVLRSGKVVGCGGPTGAKRCVKKRPRPVSPPPKNEQSGLAQENDANRLNTGGSPDKDGQQKKRVRGETTGPRRSERIRSKRSSKKCPTSVGHN